MMFPTRLILYKGKLKMLLWLTLLACSCRDHKYIETRYFSNEDQIDEAIANNGRTMKQCLQGFSLIANDDGQDSLVRTFFCDTTGNIYMIRVIYYHPIREVYQTYFSKGNIIKINAEYSRDNPYYLEHSEYYIDHDTLFLKKEGNRKFEGIENWIALNKQYYEEYSSIKVN
jgi:hypothetical protein